MIIYACQVHLWSKFSKALERLQLYMLINCICDKDIYFTIILSNFLFKKLKNIITGEVEQSDHRQMYKAHIV